MRRSRLHALFAAGLVDSFALALGWTVFTLHAASTQGLGAAGAYGAAMLAGVALSAPATGWISARLDGCRLLRATAGGEAVLRVASFALLLAGAPLMVVAAAVAVTNVLAWTAYAGMRAEVAAVDPRPRAMTAYVVMIAAVEALGVAAGALVPADRDAGWLTAVIAVYGVSLVPTLAVAGGSRVARARRTPLVAGLRRRAGELAGGFAVMALASGPTLLSAALAYELHGRSAVAAAALAFTFGSLLAPGLSARLARHGDRPAFLPLLGAGMLLGWALAPLHVGGLVVAQTLAGCCMSALEGGMDARVAQRSGERERTQALAWAASARALGSALAIAAAPAALAAWPLTGVATAGGAVLLTGALVVAAQRRRAADGNAVARPAAGAREAVTARV